MAGQILESLTTVTALAAGATTTFAPGLTSAGGVALIPNVVLPDRSTAIRVVSATSALVTVTNDGTQAETAKFRAQQEWSGTTDPTAAGSQLLWQGLGAGAAGGSAGVYKQPVRAATTAALAANTRVGNVLTSNANAALNPLDGVTLVVGDRVLVKNEAPPANNGIYDVTALGVAGGGGSSWVLTRSADADTSAEVMDGMWTTVDEGTVNANLGYILATNNPITLNTTTLQFIKRFVFDLAGTYQNGSAAASQVITLDSTRNGISIDPAASGVTLAFWVKSAAASFDGSVQIGTARATAFGAGNALVVQTAGATEVWYSTTSAADYARVALFDNASNSTQLIRGGTGTALTALGISLAGAGSMISGNGALILGSGDSTCTIGGHNVPGLVVDAASINVPLAAATTTGVAVVQATNDTGIHSSMKMYGSASVVQAWNLAAAAKCVISSDNDIIIGSQNDHVVYIGVTISNNATRPTITVASNATTGAIGFYNTAPTPQQTGVAVTAAGIHAALVTLGLITA